MYLIAFAFMALLSLPLLFPEEVRSWCRTVREWLDERQTRRDNDAAQDERLWTSTTDYSHCLTYLKQQLPHAKTHAHRYHLFAQALAASERYLKTLDRDHYPDLYQHTQRLCQWLEQERDKAKHKKGAKPSGLAPALNE